MDGAHVAGGEAVQSENALLLVGRQGAAGGEDARIKAEAALGRGGLEADFPVEPAQGGAVKGVDGVGTADQDAGMALHAGEEFVGAGDLPRAEGGAALGEKGVGLVDE